MDYTIILTLVTLSRCLPASNFHTRHRRDLRRQPPHGPILNLHPNSYALEIQSEAH